MTTEGITQDNSETQLPHTVTGLQTENSYSTSRATTFQKYGKAIETTISTKPITQTNQDLTASTMQTSTYRTTTNAEPHIQTTYSDQETWEEINVQKPTGTLDPSNSVSNTNTENPNTSANSYHGDVSTIPMERETVSYISQKGKKNATSGTGLEKEALGTSTKTPLPVSTTDKISEINITKRKEYLLEPKTDIHTSVAPDQHFIERNKSLEEDKTATSLVDHVMTTNGITMPSTINTGSLNFVNRTTTEQPHSRHQVKVESFETTIKPPSQEVVAKESPKKRLIWWWTTTQSIDNSKPREQLHNMTTTTISNYINNHTTKRTKEICGADIAAGICPLMTRRKCRLPLFKKLCCKTCLVISQM